MDILNNNLIEADSILIVDHNLNIIFFNEEANVLTGFSSAEVIGRHLQFLIENMDKPTGDFCKVLAGSESIPVISFSIRTKDDSLVKVSGSITRLPTDNPSAGNVLIVFHNQSNILKLKESLKHQSRELVEERNKLDAIFNSRLEGTFTTDRQCNITTFNRSATKITGYTSQEAIGLKCWDVFNSEYCHNACPNGNGTSGINRDSSSRIRELYITKKNGYRIPVRVSSAALLDAQNHDIGRVESFQDISELINISSQVDVSYKFPSIIGKSKSMEKVYRLIENVSQSNSTVLITGESGTGKELVARAIHLNSRRRTGPFIALNCSAFVETLLESELFGHEKGSFTGAAYTKHGRFESAQHGTLFLDEIGDVSLSIQVKLLRVLESLSFERVGGNHAFAMDVRIITATNKDIPKMLKTGEFREDFFYRINVVNITLPPLRDRLDDLPLLIQNIIRKNLKRFDKNIQGISPSVLNLMKSYDWPGNVRELENVIEHAFVMCSGKVIETEYLPENLWNPQQDAVKPEPQQTSSIKDTEKSLIETTLRKTDYHRGRTADLLGIDRATLWRKMKRYDLS